VSVADVGLVVHEVPTPTEVIRIVVKMPPAGFDKLIVVIQTEAGADPGELLQAVQHLPALPGRGAIGAPEDAGRQLMKRVLQPSAEADVLFSITSQCNGSHGSLSLGSPHQGSVAPNWGRLESARQHPAMPPTASN